MAPKNSAKEPGKSLYVDPNTEVFQSRAQMIKQENCRKQWHERWSWLLDEQAKTLEESKAIRSRLPKLPGEADLAGEVIQKRHLVPPTSNSMVGWLSANPDCQLEVYTPWRLRIPVRQPDAWKESN